MFYKSTFTEHRQKKVGGVLLQGVAPACCAAARGRAARQNNKNKTKEKNRKLVQRCQLYDLSRSSVLKAIHFSHTVQGEARRRRHLPSPQPNLPSQSVSLLQILNTNFCRSDICLKENDFPADSAPRDRLLGPWQCL